MHLPLGKKLRMARIERGFKTPGEAAKHYGCDRSTIVRLERYNAKNWTLIKLVQLCSIYRVSIFDLLGFEGAETSSLTGKIVIIYDEMTTTTKYKHHLEKALPNTTIVTFSDSVEAKVWLQDNTAAIIVTDKTLSINERKNNHKDTLNILLAGKEDVGLIKQLARNDHALFFYKDEAPTHLAQLINDTLRIH